MEPPDKFDFPFTPYDIQHSFMTSLYRILEGKQIGIFESPTGTGKSLSLTCGSLKWLLDHEIGIRNDEENKIIELETEIKNSEEENSGKVLDWIDDQYGIIKKKESLVVLKKSRDLRMEYERKIEEIRSRKMKEKKTINDWKSKIKIEDNLLEVPPEEETSFELLDLEDDDDDEILTDEIKEKYKYTKIFYCSRTHSQLSQVVNEIKGTVYGKSTRIISLASRQNYCINPEVKKLGTSALINERCLDLQKKKTNITSTDEQGRSLKKSKTCNGGCSFNSQKGNETLKEISLSEIMDIEELVEAGRKNKGCPYYSSRLAASDSQVVFLPYQMLIHRKTRELLGLDLKDSVIIIDEAHNLLDTISSIYSSEVSLDQLQKSLKQLTCYKKKYVTRFSSKNLLFINQIVFVVKRLLKIIEIEEKDLKSSRMIFTQELMAEGEFFNINLFHLLEFADKTRLAQKVLGFSQKYPEDLIIENTKQESGTSALLKRLRNQKITKKKPKINVKEVIPIKVDPSASSVIRPLLSFLESLTENCEDGRILITNFSLKYILLNPSSHFEEILKECRSLIVAGGTMQPTTEFTEQLFHLHREKIQLNFYGHVVSKDAVLPLSVAKGPTGVKFLFNFANRGNFDLLMELGRTLQNVCNVVPNGIVCFFGSYDFLNSFYESLEKNEILAKIQSKKVVFKEPRLSGQVEKILNDFGRAAKGKGLEGK